MMLSAYSFSNNESTEVQKPLARHMADLAVLHAYYLYMLISTCRIMDNATFRLTYGKTHPM